LKVRPQVVSALALAAALLMLVSAFTTVVSVDVASGSCEVLNDTNPALAEQCDQSGIDRHSVVFPLLAVAVFAMGLGAGRGGLRPAAGALAVFGAVALGIVLLNDLPASNETGVIGRDFAGAKAQAGAGLYLEAAGGLLAMVAAVVALGPAPSIRSGSRRDQPTAAG
jgi:hypothetical protein